MQARPWALTLALLAMAATARAGTTDALEPVQVTGESSAAREQKTVAQLLALTQAFEKHHALAPRAKLRIRLYPRHDDADLQGLNLSLRAEGLVQRAVPLDERQRFEIDPGWHTLPGGAVLRSPVREGRLAWHPEVRTPGLPPNTLRLGDLRLECHADLVGATHLSRGITTPAYLAMAALTDACTQPGVRYIHFADMPIFAITLIDGPRRQRLPYAHLHGSDMGQSHPLQALLDWPYRLRERSYWLPLADTSWPDDTLVVLEPMDGTQEPS